MWPLVPLPVPLAGMSFCAVGFQLGSAALRLPVTEQSQLLPTVPPTVVLPRLVSVSARSKQYSHCDSAVALPTALYGGLSGSLTFLSDAGIWPAMTEVEVCSWPGTTVSTPMNSGRFF